MRRASAIALLFSLALAAPRPALADDPPPPETADSLYNQGNEAYDRGDFALAYELYSGAFKLRQSYDVARNLGAAELKLGKYKLAATHLSYSLSLYPSNRADTKKQVVEWLDQAKAQLGAVRLTVEPESAACKLNGAALSREEQGDDVLVEPGEVAVECGVTGYRAGKSAAVVQKGERIVVRVTLEQTGSAQKPIGPVPIPVTGASSMRQPILWAGAAAAVAALGVGAGTGILSLTKAGEGDKLLADLREQTGRKAPCTVPAAKGCDDLLALRKDQDAFGNVAFWALIAGGGLGAGTALYGLVTKPAPGPAPKTAALPVIAPGAAAFVISGSW